MSTHPMPTGRVRVAGIDMGSNTTRLIVADVTRTPDGELVHEVIERISTITRLAEGVDERGILLPVPITRVRNALIEYRRVARDLGAAFVLATATSAVRDAENGDAFLGEIEHGFGFRAQLLAGDEEASTTWAGVSSDPSIARRAAAGTGLLVDIGGGSTEIVLTDRGAIVDRHSFQLGSVRLTERYLAASDPPSPEALAAAGNAVRSELEARFPDLRAPDVAIGVAGTCTTVATLSLGLASWDRDAVHGSVHARAAVRAVLDRLAVIDEGTRSKVPGLEPKRAPVILGGLVVLDELLEHAGIEELVVSDSDILDGIALRAGSIALDEGITELVEPFGNTCC